MSPDTSTTALAIAGAAGVTYALRLGGLLLAARLPRGGAFKRVMDALPGAILVALVAPGILAAGPWGILAAGATVLCAARTGSTFLSMAVGMAIVALRRQLPF
ncbi:MAG: AzlD domain-containing protein [Pseudomonadota bacterium]